MKSKDGRKIKVLVVSHLYPDEVFESGAGTGGVFVHEQVKALRQLCDVEVLVPRDCMPRRDSRFVGWWRQVARLPRRVYAGGVKIHVVRFVAVPPRRHFLLGYGAAAFLPVLHKIQRIKKDFDFDIIHAHTTVPDGISAVWVGRVLSVPTVITSHGGDIYHFPANGWNRATLQYTLNRTGRVISVSSNLKQRIVALGVPDWKITVIPNGFDPTKFSLDGNANPESMRIGSEKVILFLGKLVPRKDPLILLESVKLLRAMSHRVRLVMVGDGPLRNQVKEKVVQLGLGECVELVGEVSHSRVPNYIRSADLLCLPSHAEGWPTVIFEALSLGVPVVASRVGGNPEAIHSEDYGLLVEAGDLAGLTEALDRGLRTAWDRANIQTYAAGFTWHKIAELIHQEYDTILSERDPGIHQGRRSTH